MTERIFFILTIFFIFIVTSFAQTSKWENFTDMKNITSIAFDHNSSTVYCASKGGLFVVNASSAKVDKKYTNLNGLINNNLTTLVIDNNRRLWVGAIDGSISILNLDNFTWKYIFDIKNSTESNKAVNFILPGGNFMFIATNYGIHKISAASFSFVDAPYYKLGSFPINTQVNALALNNNILYAATKSGIAYGNIINSNLNNPTSWTNFNSAPMNADVLTIEAFDNKVFAGSATGFSYFDGNSWLPYPNALVSNQNTKFIKTIGDKIYFISNNNIYFATSNNLSAITIFQNPNNYSTIASDNNMNPIVGLTDKGILINTDSGYEFTFPNGPFTNIFNQITIDDDNNIWAAGEGFYKFDGALWTNYNTATFPAIGNSNSFPKIVAGRGVVWALGFGGGPTLVNGNNIYNFNTSNSSLPGSISANYCVPYGGAFDINGVFWISIYQTNSSKSLYAYLGGNQTTGEWIGFSNPSLIGGQNANLSEVVIDSYNTKWVVGVVFRTGVYFFNENGTLDNPDDDIFGFYSVSEFGSEITNISDIIVDKNNEVWITTNNGIFIINNPFAAIQNPNQKPAPQKLGIISGNLKVPFTENCISITNDILNDKWIGTETNGVFHLSSDGSTLIEQFNTSKSPILDNKIRTIAVSNKTGKAYFGTQNGLSSYLTDAIEPVADFDVIIVSPNPYIIPSNFGLKIDGLIENSFIKIITLDGKIVEEFNSPGGRIAMWDGKNKNNELIPTGIYIIVAYNKDGSKVGTGKVAVVRK